MRKWKETVGSVNLDYMVADPANNMYLFEVTARSGESHLTAVVFRDGVVLSKIGVLLTDKASIDEFMNLQSTLIITIEGQIEEFTRLKDKTAVNKIEAKKSYSDKY